MTWAVTVHMCSGSSGEAIMPVAVVQVETEYEATQVEKIIHAHPAAEHGDHLWAIKHDLGEPLAVADAVKSLMDQTDYFELDDDEDEDEKPVAVVTTHIMRFPEIFGDGPL